MKKKIQDEKNERTKSKKITLILIEAGDGVRKEVEVADRLGSTDIGVGTTSG
jgi:hypothetical protein